MAGAPQQSISYLLDRYRSRGSALSFFFLAVHRLLYLQASVRIVSQSESSMGAKWERLTQDTTIFLQMLAFRRRLA